VSNDKVAATAHPKVRIRDISIVPEGEGFPGSHIELVNEEPPPAPPPTTTDEG
jgi:hypothetical protein